MFPAIIFCLLFSLTKANFLVEEECLNYTVYPVQYELTIIPYVHQEKSHYHCDIMITVIANANVRVIEMDAKDLDIQTGSIRVLDGNTDIVNSARPYEYNEASGKLLIYLREPLRIYNAKNAQFYYIKMSFNKFVREDNTGLFLVKYYEDEQQDMKYLFTSRLSPNKAKYSFPCFDNPRFEAVFKFKVYIVPETHGLQYTNTTLVISPELKREITKDNYTIVEYIPSPQVALHQIGFHVSQFTHNQDKNETIIVWAPRNKLKYFDFISKFGEDIIKQMHKYANTNRPVLKGPINIIAVPNDLNGYEMGSWNLLTISADRIANIEHLTSIRQLERMMFELTQQLSRTWLGNPGESERTRWKEEWFKEGVATYFAYYFLAQYHFGSSLIKERQPLGLYGLQMKHKAMSIDWHKSTPALEAFNNSLAIEIPPRYRELVTLKTGALFWMLEDWLGSKKFHEALVKYINSRRGKYISVADFMSSLDMDTVECSYQFFNGSTSSRILKSWFHRTGYPVVSVEVLRDRTPNAIQLKQRQFSFTRDNRHESEYLIPISYLMQNKENCYNCYSPRFTIGRQTYTFGENLNGGWIILNRKGSGYYRVNYDRFTWKLIAKALNDDILSIDEINRAQLSNDVLALYVAEDIDISLALEVLDYLDKERSYMVWDSVISGYDLLRMEGAASNMTKHLYWEWEDFMRKKIGGIYEQVVKDGNQRSRIRLFRHRILTFASEIGYEPCHAYLRQIYDESRRGKEILDPDSREACYYMLSNDTNSHFTYTKINNIEQDDRLLAQHKVREQNRFLIKIPYGEPRPESLLATERPTSAPVTEKITSVGDDSVIHLVSLMTMFVCIVINLLV